MKLKVLTFILISVLLVMFMSSSILASEKFSVKKTEKVSKFSLGTLKRHCADLKVVSAIKNPEPIRLNSDLPTQRCHLEPYYYDYQLGRWVFICRSGAGAVRCPCGEEDIPQ